MLTIPIELLPDTLSDVDLTEELPEQLELADSGDIGEGRGIAGDDYGSLSWRSVSRSCSRSSAAK